MITTHFLSRRRFNENNKMSASSNRHVVLKRRPKGIDNRRNSITDDNGLLMMT